MIKCTLDKNS